MEAYADIADLPEDDRITMIGRTCMAKPGNVIGFVVEHDSLEKGKAQRYIRKLITQFPKLKIMETIEHAPTESMTVVKVTFPKAE